MLEVRPREGQDCFTALLERVEDEYGELDQALLSSGALLIRGYAVETTEQFAELVSRLAGSKALREYLGGASPRHALPGSKAPVYISTEYPAHIELPLHLWRQPAHPPCHAAGGAKPLRTLRLAVHPQPAAGRGKRLLLAGRLS
jgi:hypothetical protein